MTAVSKLAISAILTVITVAGCDTKDDGAGDGSTKAATDAAAPAAPSNRVDIPAAVRNNLGITFAKAEMRAVAVTLRVPGQFELTPTARREYRTALGGRVEPLVAQYQSVEAGTPLYRIDSPAWRDLHEQIAAVQAKVDSMAPLREAHRVHERSLQDKVTLWEERMLQLTELRAAGGGSAAQFTEARAALNATQAELADVMEKDAELHADEMAARASLRSLKSRHDLLVKASGVPHEHDHGAAISEDSYILEPFEVRAVAPGIIESLAITTGGLAEESGLILTVVQPHQIRFRARGLQADLGRLRDGLAAAIVPPQGTTIAMQDAMTGLLRLGLTADPRERTIDLVVTPAVLSSWARAGVAAHMEITLDGGDEDLAVPASTIARDGSTPILFRRDPKDPNKAIRLEADIGLSDGRWVVVRSGLREGDEVVLDGVYQLMLATSGNVGKGGHFHSDGTFHEGENK